MNNFYTCIECGYYPVSSTAHQCPRCSKNPFGKTCLICNIQVAESKAILHQEFDNNSDYYKNYHFHSECLNKAPYKCPVCSASNTGFGNYLYDKSCSRCGHTFKVRRCQHCRKPVLEASATRGDSILGDGFFHFICAVNIRPKLEESAREKAKREEEKRIIEAQQRKEKEARDQIRREEQRQKQEIDRKQQKIDDWWRERAFGIIAMTIISGVLGILTIKSIFLFSTVCFVYFFYRNIFDFCRYGRRGLR